MLSLRLRRVAAAYALPALIAWAALAVFGATRLALLLSPDGPRGNRPDQIVQALAKGAAFDFLVALWIAFPFVAGRLLRGPRPGKARLATVALALTLGLLFFGAAVEYVFFQELGGRFNFVAVDYLVYPTEVGENIWQSYPTAPVLLAVTAAALLLARAAGPLLRRAAEQAESPLAVRVGVLIAIAGVSIGMSLALPARASRVGRDRSLNEVAGNGYYTFWQALLGRDAPYEGLYRTGQESQQLERLRLLLSEPASSGSTFSPASTSRRIRSLHPPRRFHVVVVLEESLGSEFVGSLDPGGSGLTPEFDRLAREGTLLSHAYSTGNRTIRALEATTASLPPLPGISIVRREASRDLFTLPALLRQRGYRTLFVYGGRALFDGMGAYLRANGVERIVDEDDFSKDAFHTAWGVCDEAIFDRALGEMDRLDGAGEAVYMLTLTVSNHRPFLYPTGRIPLDPSARRRRHAVRYADWALGRFVAAARRRPWFSRTLFVLMGDHGARVYGAAAIPMASYQVPILFFAPKLVPARRVDTLASSLDVPPTVLGILGLEYDSKFFGRDVLALPPSRGRALMTHNREVALLEGPTLAVLGLKSSALVYRYDSASGELRPVERPGPAENAVVQDAVAYYCEADRIYRSGRYRFEGKPPPAKLTRVGEGRWHGARPGG